MTNDKSIYWVCLEPETDMSNQDLYFPPDTPTTNLNHKRMYAMLKKRHARQWERLKIQQVSELGEYQCKFSVDYQDDLFLKPTTTACEIISGSDYINTNNEAISEVLSNIPTIIAENNMRKEPNTKNDKPDQRRSEYLGILAKKYNTGLEAIGILHESQIRNLKQLQSEDMQVLPREIRDSSRERSLKSRTSSTSPPVSSDNDKRRRRLDDDLEAKKQRKDDKPRSESSRRHETSSSRPDMESSRHARTSSTERSSSDKVPSRTDTSATRNERLSSNERSSSNKQPASRNQKQHSNERPLKKEKLSASSSKREKNSKGKGGDMKPTLAPEAMPRKPKMDNQPPGINVGIPTNARPPTIGVGIPTNTRPPTIGSSKTANPKSMSRTQKPSEALFHNKSYHNLPTLMDRGSLLVQNKPNRVIIRSQNGTSTTYGNPKDYDDAINSSSTRPDNPVHKRRIRGVDYLFYKTESNHVVTIGPVSEIQPLIHKFFLSM